MYGKKMVSKRSVKEAERRKPPATTRKASSGTKTKHKFIPKKKK